MKQKGFIAIPLLIVIIASVIAVSTVTTGVVLYKQGKLASITANISQIFKGAEEIAITEETELKELQTERLKISQEEIVRQEQKSAEKTKPESEIKLIEEETVGPEFIPKVEESEITPEIEEETSQIEQESQPEPEYESEPEVETDSCAGVNCSDCQYCNLGSCINYCQNTDNSCGCTDCVSCNNSDGCSGNNYLDYYCSDNSCIYTRDSCSDCSCSCGGYNTEENIENGNCEDGKDNDCDGNIDSSDPGCESFQLNEQDIEYSISPKEIKTSTYTDFVCHLKILKPNFDYSKIKGIYFNFYNEKDDIYNSFSAGVGSLGWENNKEEFTFPINVIYNKPGVWKLLSIRYDIKYSNTTYSLPISNGIDLVVGEQENTVLTSPLGGNITQNSKLTLTNSPYIVTETIQVLEGVTLEIEPGVTVKFERNTGINVGGMLKAIGTKSKVITFTSNNGNPSARDWNEINFTDLSNDAIVSDTTYVSGSIIENCKIEYAYRGIWINNSSPFISSIFFTHNENSLMLSYGNSVIINNTIINSNKAVYLHGSSPTIFNNTITDNIEAFEIGAGSSPNISKNIIKDNENGFSICCYANPTIQYNNILNNGENGETLWLSQVSDIIATNNYWGTTDSSIVDNIIHDYYDNINLGKVNYQPIATSEIPDAGVQ